MKSYIKKRKHRNGVRPQRKGALKIRMIEFPEKWFQYSFSTVLFKKYIDASNEFADSLLAGRGDATLKRKSDVWNKAHAQANRGYFFVSDQKQHNPLDLALDAINGVEPKHTKQFNASSSCGACKFNGNCLWSGRSADDKRIKCPTVRRAFQDQALSGQLTQSLSTSEIAALAVQHLS